MSEPFLRVDRPDQDLETPKPTVHWGGRQNFVVTILPWLLVLPAFTAICFSFYWDPFVVYSVIILTGLVAIFIAVLDFVAGRKMLFYSGILGMAGICIAVGMGSFIYQRWVKQYFHLKSSRIYENVLPTESAAAHKDGGVLNFAVGIVFIFSIFFCQISKKLIQFF